MLTVCSRDSPETPRTSRDELLWENGEPACQQALLASESTARDSAQMTHNQEAPRHAGPTVRQRPRSAGGRRSRHGAGRTPQAGAAAQAASGSRSWCRRRGRTARAWRPARGRRPSRRRAALRTALTAPRSAGPGPGLAKSPPRQASEHMFGIKSGMLPTRPDGSVAAPPAHAVRMTRPGDSECGPEGRAPPGSR
jgi:hypothetical protein